MAEIDDKKGKYTVILVGKDTTKYLTGKTVTKTGATPPRYDKQTDDAAFHAAWQKVGQARTQRCFKVKPKITESSIKLRVARNKAVTTA